MVSFNHLEAFRPTFGSCGQVTVWATVVQRAKAGLCQSIVFAVVGFACVVSRNPSRIAHVHFCLYPYLIPLSLAVIVSSFSFLCLMTHRSTWYEVIPQFSYIKGTT